MNLKNHFKDNEESFRMLYTDSFLTDTMQKVIYSWLPNQQREHIVVCVGTDRSTGDALGPLTGHYLSEFNLKHMIVYGTLQDPVHATNLEKYITYIQNNHNNPFIIAVDACLGKPESVGHLIANKGPLRPGAALNKPLPEIGDIHVTGVVNISGFMEYHVLQNTRLSIVNEMARRIAIILESIDQQLSQKNVGVFMPSIKKKSI